MRRVRALGAGIIALLLLITVLATAPQSAQAAAQVSDKVALVPSANGQAGNGGQLPTSNFPNGYAPTFTDLLPTAIRDDVVDPIVAGAYDTVVLAQLCDVGTYLADAQFKSRLEGFVNAGGKLLIWDSECSNTDYSNFAIPFTTNNPGAAGAVGVLTDVEENSLSSTNPASPAFVDAAKIANDTDAAGDANVFVTKDARWCVDFTGTNVNQVTGPLHNYVPLGSGLVIYSGLDYDVLSNGQGFDPTGDGTQQLGRLWLNELLIGPSSSLPCGIKAFGMTLTPPTATLNTGTTHTVTATLTDNASPAVGVTVTFTVTAGPNTGATGTGVTDANGQATFSYTSTVEGTDTITATATISDTAVSDTATVTWVAPVGTGPAEAVRGEPNFTG